MTIVVVHSLGGALVCLAGIGLWMLLRELLKPTPAPAAAVAQTSEVSVYLTGFGTVQAYNTVTVRARVDGAVDKVVFVEGQDVKAGDLLAQIDPRPFQAQFDQVVAAKARDQALLANAELDLQPYQKVVAQNSIGVQQRDTQIALVAQEAATVKNDQAQIDYARVQLGYTAIASPIADRTGVRIIDAGIAPLPGHARANARRLGADEPRGRVSATPRAYSRTGQPSATRRQYFQAQGMDHAQDCGAAPGRCGARQIGHPREGHIT